MESSDAVDFYVRIKGGMAIKCLEQSFVIASFKPSVHLLSNAVDGGCKKKNVSRRMALRNKKKVRENHYCPTCDLRKFKFSDSSFEGFNFFEELSKLCSRPLHCDQTTQRTKIRSSGLTRTRIRPVHSVPLCNCPYFGKG